jgi:hypothetical protein
MFISYIRALKTRCNRQTKKPSPQALEVPQALMELNKPLLRSNRASGR